MIKQPKGRPAMGTDEKRNYSLLVRMNLQERNDLEELAHTTGKGKAVIIRMGLDMMKEKYMQ